MSDQKKLAFFLPNIFTALNMACGFWSILWSAQGKFYEACFILIVGGVFDMVDGRVARLTGTSSSFGEQFDSLSDLISFGIAPSLLFYYGFLSDIGRFGILAAFVYMLCGALRLARFNANIDHVSSDFFQGLPIPSGAMALVGFTLFSLFIPKYAPRLDYFAPFYIFGYGLLMISNIPFCSFKNSSWGKGHRKQALFLVFMLFVILFIELRITLFALVNIYVVGSIVYYVIHRSKFKGIFDWKGDHEGETN